MSNLKRLEWRIVVFFLVGLLIVAADQLTKTWIRANIAPGHTIYDLGFFRLVNVQNTGAAFGIFPGQSEILTVVAIAGIIALLVCAFLSRRYLPVLDSTVSMIALGMVLGGTIGNLIDRLQFGYVTDFLDFKIWPIFNVADSCVTVGIIIIAYSLIRVTLKESD
ncbi:MAG: signal peptidase II [Dehalococcoidales bacterium]|nr:signal peptidase II [Dehalococcoidales bacterium]